MMTENPPPPVLTDAANRSSGSFELVLGPVLMALLGLAIDSWLGTRPVFTVLFTVWGAIGATVAIYYRYRHQAQATAQLRAVTAPPARRGRQGRRAPHEHQ